MFAFRDEEVFVVFVVFGFGFLALWLVLNHKTRALRLQTIQKALEANTLDDATRRQLIAALHADAQRMPELVRTILNHGKMWVRTLLFVGGWLTFVIGGLFLLGMYLSGARYMHDWEPAAIATAIGFALVTLPVAIAELERTQKARTQR